jgi:hypothetical protein
MYFWMMNELDLMMNMLDYLAYRILKDFFITVSGLMFLEVGVGDTPWMYRFIRFYS